MLTVNYISGTMIIAVVVALISATADDDIVDDMVRGIKTVIDGV